MGLKFKKGDRVCFTNDLREICVPVDYFGVKGTIEQVLEKDVDGLCYLVSDDKDNMIWHMSDDYLRPADEIPKRKEEYYDKHYLECVVEPIKVMEEQFTHEEFVGFLKGCILKYRLRMGLKDGEELTKEIAKLKRYTQWLNEAQSGNKITL